MPVVSTLANIAVSALGFGKGTQYWQGVITDSNIQFWNQGSMRTMSNGNIAISFSIANAVSTSFGGCPMVIGPDGTFKWAKTFYISGQNTYGGDLAIDSSDNVFMAGYYATDDDVLILKFDSSGSHQFSRRISSTNPLAGRGCALSPDGLYTYLGAGVNVTSDDVAVIKYDNTSLLITWDQLISTSNTYQWLWNKVAVDSSSNAYVMIEDLTEDNICISKWLSGGTASWQKAFVTATATTSVVGHGIAIGSSDDVYFSFADLTSDALHIVKCNSAGTVQWSRKLTNTNLVMGSSVGGLALDSSDNVYVCSPYQISSIIGTTTYVLLAKYNSSGSLQWQRILDYYDTSFNFMTPGDMALTVNSNGIFMATRVTSTSGSNMHLVRLPTDGSKIGTYTLPANIGTTAGTFDYNTNSFTDSAHTLTTGTDPAGTTVTLTNNITTLPTIGTTTPTVSKASI